MRRATDQAGQVMVEACLAISLLCFVWIAVVLATHMQVNHIRTLMGARHYAWLCAHKGDRPDSVVKAKAEEVLDEGIFYKALDNKLLTVPLRQPGKGSMASFIKSDGKEYTKYSQSHYVEVSYGLTLAKAKNSKLFPFSMTGVEFPYLPPLILEDSLMVTSHCQWDATGRLWTEFKEAMSGVWGLMKSALADFSGLAGKVVSMVVGLFTK